VFEPWRHDPGPCPVDDAPHTTCTAPSTITSSVQPSQHTSARIIRPGWITAPAPAPTERTVSAEFSTTTFKPGVFVPSNKKKR